MSSPKMKTHRLRELSWSELPPELLPAIAKRLEARTDILHFRRVCKTWRASAPLSLLDSKTILTPLLPHKLPDSEKNYTKFLVAHSVFLIKSDANPNLPPWLCTAEELFPGSLCVRLPLSRNIADYIVMPIDFPSELDLSKFRVLELGMFYNYSYVDSNNTSFGFDVRVIDNPVFRTKPSFPHEYKIVLFMNPNCATHRPSLDDCMIVELSNEIALTVKSLKSGEERKVYFTGKRKFDDIVSFKGKIYGVDRKGRVCSMDYNSLKMSSVVEEPLWEGSGSENKKRLVVSSDDILYLVYRWSKKGNAAFKVFKLNEEEEKWDMVDGIGSDRMLFVTPDGCFFAAVKDFPGWRGNCIVFPWGCFPQYSGKTALDSKIFMAWDEFSVAVYHFEGDDCDLVYVYPGYADLFWPPPSWLWTDLCLNTSGMDSEGGEQRKDKESVKSKVEVEEHGQGGDGEHKNTSNNKLLSDSSCHNAPELIHEEVNPHNGAQLSQGIQTNQKHIVHKEFKGQKNGDSAPAVNSSKIAEKDVSQAKFLGVDVSSHLIPIMQKIWDKYGNILEGHAVNSGSLLTWALESLAKMVVFLENNEGRSLDKSEANYLNSVLLDLRLMHFKLDWLMPSVERVLAPHKNKLCMDLEMTNLKFQTEFHWTEETLAEQTKLVSENQMGSAEGPCPLLNLLSFMDKH